jgi:hypothetical protein
LNLLLDGLPEEAVIGGQTVKIETDFRTGILFEEVIRDPNLDDTEKIRTALELYFPGVSFKGTEAIQEAVGYLLWFYRCGEETTDNEPSEEAADGDIGDEQPFSYEHDAGYIYAAFLQAYHMDLARQNLHWWQFRALFTALPEDTQIMKIIGYRTMKIPDKLPREQKQHYQRMKRLYRLPQSEDRQQLESDLSTLLMNGGNPSALLTGGRESWHQTEP